VKFKALILLICGLVLSDLAHANASILQEQPQARTGAGVTQVSTAFTLNCTPGSTIEVGVTFNHTIGAYAPTSVVDSASQTYTLKASSYNGANDATIAVYIFQNNTSSAKLTVTVTWATAPGAEGVWPREVGGVTSSPYQTSITNYQSVATTSADAITTTTVAPTSAPALVSGWQLEGFPSVASVAGTGETAGQTGFGNWGVTESKRVTSTSAVASTWTNTTDGGTSGLGFATIEMIYTEASTGAPPSRMFLSQ
jgi:hypothetical protein